MQMPPDPPEAPEPAPNAPEPQVDEFKVEEGQPDGFPPAYPQDSDE